MKEEGAVSSLNMWTRNRDYAKKEKMKSINLGHSVLFIGRSGLFFCHAPRRWLA